SLDKLNRETRLHLLFHTDNWIFRSALPACSIQRFHLICTGCFGTEDWLDRQTASFAELIASLAPYGIFSHCYRRCRVKSPEQGFQLPAKECWHEHED
ncbi:hypothetical protein INR49_009859, partial [Caranx melampygus]